MEVLMPPLEGKNTVTMRLSEDEMSSIVEAGGGKYVGILMAIPDKIESIMRIVRNACYTWLHANRPLQDAAEYDENIFPPDSCTSNPEEAVLQNDSSALLRKALEKLPPSFREVLILREIEGMSYREIADITDMPAGTVMSSLSRARGRLRQAVMSLMNDDMVPGSQRMAAQN